MIPLRKGLTIVDDSKYEYGRTYYYFRYIYVNEFINLLDIMKYYYGDKDNEIVLKFKYSDYRMINYSIPDAGMERNEIRQLDNDVVRISFVYTL